MTAESLSPPLRFFLNGEYQELGDIQPTTTVLNFLREQLQLSGSKEGCAEGDCGACTVVVTERFNDRVRFRSINACIQFLPVLDGKLVYTVEGLKNQKDGQLHPVQKAMVLSHGSQCGFCTPGFVMSLFALFKTTENPDRDSIDDALAGNLCRCTGYRPIIDAAKTMVEIADSLNVQERNYLETPFKQAEHDVLSEGENMLLAQLESIKPTKELVIDDTYYAPTTIDELTQRLTDNPQAILLAGGTDVGLWVTCKWSKPFGQSVV